MKIHIAAFAIAAIWLSLLPGCQMQKEKSAVPTTGVVNLGPAEDFPAGTANNGLLIKYGIIVVNNGGTPLAILPQCTYGSATLTWDRATDQFICPMHGCRFDMLGRPVQGPAKKQLHALVPDRQPDGTLTLDLGKLHNQ